MTIGVAVTLVALVALLVTDRMGVHAGVWIAKPLASTGFLATAVAAGALERIAGGEVYALGVLAGLVLSWWGDVLLIPEDRPGVFRAGILAFLLGHVAYVVAFASQGLAWPVALAVAAGLAVVGWRVLAWLAPRVPASLAVPVRAYVVVISAMVVCAAATGHPARPTILLGASMFFVSDLAVARDRFVAPGFSNHLWGLPLYYGGQLVLATSVAV